MKYKNFDVPDDAIDNLVDNLGVSIAYACEIWLADKGMLENEEQTALDKKAKTQGRHYESTKERKPAKKERKVDYNKADLLKIMAIALIEKAECTEMTQKTETELHFTYKNDDYTVKLTKHRPKKA